MGVKRGFRDPLGTLQGVAEYDQGLSRKPPFKSSEKFRFMKILEGLPKIWGLSGEF